MPLMKLPKALRKRSTSNAGTTDPSIVSTSRSSRPSSVADPSWRTSNSPPPSSRSASSSASLARRRSTLDQFKESSDAPPVPPIPATVSGHERDNDVDVDGYATVSATYVNSGFGVNGYVDGGVTDDNSFLPSSLPLAPTFSMTVSSSTPQRGGTISSTTSGSPPVSPSSSMMLPVGSPSYSNPSSQDNIHSRAASRRYDSGFTKISGRKFSSSTTALPLASSSNVPAHHSPLSRSVNPNDFEGKAGKGGHGGKSGRSYSHSNSQGSKSGIFGVFKKGGGGGKEKGKDRERTPEPVNLASSTNSAISYSSTASSSRVRPTLSNVFASGSSSKSTHTPPKSNGPSSSASSAAAAADNDSLPIAGRFATTSAGATPVQTGRGTPELHLADLPSASQQVPGAAAALAAAHENLQVESPGPISPGIGGRSSQDAESYFMIPSDLGHGDGRTRLDESADEFGKEKGDESLADNTPLQPPSSGRFKMFRSRSPSGSSVTSQGSTLVDGGKKVKKEKDKGNQRLEATPEPESLSGHSGSTPETSAKSPGVSGWRRRKLSLSLARMTTRDPILDEKNGDRQTEGKETTKPTKKKEKGKKKENESEKVDNILEAKTSNDEHVGSDKDLTITNKHHAQEGELYEKARQREAAKQKEKEKERQRKRKTYLPLSTQNLENITPGASSAPVEPKSENLLSRDDNGTPIAPTPPPSSFSLHGFRTVSYSSQTGHQDNVVPRLGHHPMESDARRKSVIMGGEMMFPDSNDDGTKYQRRPGETQGQGQGQQSQQSTSAMTSPDNSRPASPAVLDDPNNPYFADNDRGVSVPVSKFRQAKAARSTASVSSIARAPSPGPGSLSGHAGGDTRLGLDLPTPSNHGHGPIQNYDDDDDVPLVPPRPAFLGSSSHTPRSSFGSLSEAGGSTGAFSRQGSSSYLAGMGNAMDDEELDPPFEVGEGGKPISRPLPGRVSFGRMLQDKGRDRSLPEPPKKNSSYQAWHSSEGGSDEDDDRSAGGDSDGELPDEAALRAELQSRYFSKDALADKQSELPPGAGSGDRSLLGHSTVASLTSSLPSLPWGWLSSSPQTLPAGLPPGRHSRNPSNSSAASTSYPVYQPGKPRVETSTVRPVLSNQDLKANLSKQSSRAPVARSKPIGWGEEDSPVPMRTGTPISRTVSPKPPDSASKALPPVPGLAEKDLKGMGGLNSSSNEKQGENALSASNDDGSSDDDVPLSQLGQPSPIADYDHRRLKGSSASSMEILANTAAVVASNNGHDAPSEASHSTRSSSRSVPQFSHPPPTAWNASGHVSSLSQPMVPIPPSSGKTSSLSQPQSKTSRNSMFVPHVQIPTNSRPVDSPRSAGDIPRRPTLTSLAEAKQSNSNTNNANDPGHNRFSPASSTSGSPQQLFSSSAASEITDSSRSSFMTPSSSGGDRSSKITANTTPPRPRHKSTTTAREDGSPPSSQKRKPSLPHLPERQGTNDQKDQAEIFKRMKDRHRAEAKKAIDIGNDLNGSGPREDERAPLPRSVPSYALSTMAGGSFPPMGLPQPSFPHSNSINDMPPPPGVDPNLYYSLPPDQKISLHQRGQQMLGMMAAAAQQAKATSDAGWETGSNTGSVAGGVGGSSASAYGGMGGMGGSNYGGMGMMPMQMPWVSPFSPFGQVQYGGYNGYGGYPQQPYAGSAMGHGWSSSASAIGVSSSASSPLNPRTPLKRHSRPPASVVGVGSKEPTAKSSGRRESWRAV